MTQRMLRRRSLLTGAIATATALPAIHTHAADPLLIALAAPMTGTSAAMGLNGTEGADMALAEINAQGGIGGRPLKYVTFDDHGAPKDAATVAQQIIGDERFFAVLGHVNSSCTLAAMPIYADAGIAVLCNSSSNPSITEQGWTNFIRMTGRDDFGAQEYSAFMINNQGRRKLGLFYVNNDFGRGLRDQIVKAVRVLQGKVVIEGTFTPGVDRNFQPIVSQMKAAGVDGILMMTEYTEGALFLSQARELGLSGVPVVGPDSNLYDKFIELSLGASEGAYILAAYDPFSVTPVARQFIDAFRAKYHSIPSQVAVFTRDILFLVKDAVEQHGATKQTLIQTVKSMQFDGAGGHFAWTQKGDTKNRTHFVLQVRDGKFVSTGIKIDEHGLESLRG